MSRARATVAAAALASALVSVLAPGAARADEPAAPSPHRRIAVLEYRGGSAELTGVGQRVADLLRRRTSLDVLGADKARARFPELDQEVSRCGGRAGCVARIGRKLGVADVVLVGVGDFGDVILTIQRVDVARAESLTRVAEALAAGARPTDEDLEGYLARVLPPTDFRRFGVIRIAADLAGAEVAVGGRERGVTPVAPVRVPAPARYDIRVRKAGFVDFRATVDVPPEAEVVVRAELTRRSVRPWYARWWVVGVAGVVVVGAVATTAVIASRGDDQVPVVVGPF